MNAQADESEAGSTRRCVLTGEHCGQDDLIRLVLSPDGDLLPDLDAKLPGRGLWVKLDRKCFEGGIKSGKLVKQAAHNFAKSPKHIAIADDLGQQVDGLLNAQALKLLGLERRAGTLSLGFEKVRAKCQKGRVQMVLTASDAGPDAVQKINGPAAQADIPVVRIFNRTELALALGRDNVVHAALDKASVTKSLPRIIRRLSLYRGLSA